VLAEQKLLRLGLDPAAHQGEVDNCGAMLLRSLRKRGVNAEQFIASMTQSTWAARELMAARGRVMTFGKYKGQTIGELPLDYIRYALNNFDNMALNVRKAMQLVLNQGRK
jgi:uncharacterized protein (DUF3820 family)